MPYAAFLEQSARVVAPAVGGKVQLMAATIPALRGPSPL